MESVKIYIDRNFPSQVDKSKTVGLTGSWDFINNIFSVTCVANGKKSTKCCRISFRNIYVWSYHAKTIIEIRISMSNLKILNCSGVYTTLMHWAYKYS